MLATSVRSGLEETFHDGSVASGEVAAVAAVAALEGIGALGGHPVKVLQDVARPDVWGGGRPVGTLEPRLELRFE